MKVLIVASYNKKRFAPFIVETDCRRNIYFVRETPDYELIEQIGIHKISGEQLRELLERRFLLQE